MPTMQQLIAGELKMTEEAKELNCTDGVPEGWKFLKNETESEIKGRHEAEIAIEQRLSQQLAQQEAIDSFRASRASKFGKFSFIDEEEEIEAKRMIEEKLGF